MRNKFLFLICILNFLVIGVGMTDKVTVKAQETDFDISDEGVLERYNGSDESIVIPDGVTVIGDGAFSYSGITDIIIPDSVTRIESTAFSDCEKLVNIKFSSNLTTIEPWAFSSCSSLKSLTLPEGLKTIGEAAFISNESLTSVTIPKSVEFIGDIVFSNCYSLKKIKVDKKNKNYKDIDGVLFKKTTSGDCLITYPVNKKGSVYKIPEKVTAIEFKAFYYCNNLKDIEIPNSVKSIGPNAFLNCKNLKSLKIPYGVKTIQYAGGSFWGCNSLKKLEMSVKKGEKLTVKVVLDEGSSLKKPAITSENGNVASVSKAIYKTDSIGETSAKITVSAKNKGKTAIVFQRIVKQNKTVKHSLILTVK